MWGSAFAPASVAFSLGLWAEKPRDGQVPCVPVDLQAFVPPPYPYFQTLFPFLPLSGLELLSSHRSPASVKTPEGGGEPINPLLLHSSEGASQPLCRGLIIAVAKQQEVEVAEDNAVLS